MALIRSIKDIEKALKKLRAKFPESDIQYKPIYIGDYSFDSKTGSSYIPDDAYQKCPVCGKTHPLPAKHLKYVGHARITQRLNDVDPNWSWRPYAEADDGTPMIKNGALWIYLTVCGITRIGVGDSGGRHGPDAIKEMIGDAIRNAAMRFGCGLEMWFEDDSDDSIARAPHGGQEDRDDESASEALSLPETDEETKKARLRLSRAIADRILKGYVLDVIDQDLAERMGKPWSELSSTEAESAMDFLQAEYPLDDDVIAV